MTHFTDTTDIADPKVATLATPADPKPPGSTYIAPVVRPVPAGVDPLLATILSWPRAHDSKSEQKFCKWLRDTIARLAGVPATISELGCIVARIDYATEPPTASTTLFSCHLDTIDPLEPPKDWGKKQFKKDIVYDPTMGEIFLAKGSAGGSLGADDGVGVWIMLNMLAAKVPGTYVFHRGEEQHGLGSYAMLAKQRDWLTGFEAAVAFDRGNDFEIITHQGGLRCASDKYAEALIAQFDKQGMQYGLSKGGTFTDTKVYRGVIAECINVGVGYHSQHGINETLDYTHALALKDALLNMNFDALPIDRDPTAADPAPVYNSYQGNYGGKWDSKTHTGKGKHWGGDDAFAFDLEDYYAGMGAAKVAKTKPARVSASNPASKHAYDSLLGTPLVDIEAWFSEDPEAAASTMSLLMLEIAELRARSRTLEGLIGLDV